MIRFRRVVALVLLASRAVAAEDPPAHGTIEEVIVTPLGGSGVGARELSAPVREIDAAALAEAQAADLSDYLARRLGSVNLNIAQGNPLQPDLNYRGFTASPLLGLPQGIAVYRDGVRLNEPLGETVNWDLIGQTSLARAELWPGSNALFGLNALGGAIALRSKDGFTHPGHALSASGGSFGRVVVGAESGGSQVLDRENEVAQYLALDVFREDGWRDYSRSRAVNLFGSLGWRRERAVLEPTRLHLDLAIGDSKLRGNGATPLDLIDAERRSSVFTHPDRTENALQQVALRAGHWLTDDIELVGLLSYRRTTTDSVNGDGSPFDECRDPANDGLRCHDGDDVVLDESGQPLTEEEDAVRNGGDQEQQRYGATVQLVGKPTLAGLSTQLTFGVDLSRAVSDFESDVEIARLSASRKAVGTGRFVAGQDVDLRATNLYWSAFFSGVLRVTDSFSLLGSARYNDLEIQLRDRTGLEPRLNGTHDFRRVDGSGGVAYAFSDWLQASYRFGQASRAPSAVELACADPGAPCRLPNAFVSDPPLDEVVSRTHELSLSAGYEGELGSASLRLTGFHTINRDDILFISTGGATANEGYFSNVGDTRRAGVEVALRAELWRTRWSVQYSWLRARFGDGFRVSSPNHPRADPNGEIPVESGDRIPNLPEHTLKADLGIDLTDSLRLGAELLYESDRYYRGDEANLLDTIDGYSELGLRASYDLSRLLRLERGRLELFGRVQNLLDAEYETFGVLGDAEEVLGDSASDPRFVTPSQPRAFWFGIRGALF